MFVFCHKLLSSFNYIDIWWWRYGLARFSMIYIESCCMYGWRRKYKTFLSSYSFIVCWMWNPYWKVFIHFFPSSSSSALLAFPSLFLMLGVNFATLRFLAINNRSLYKIRYTSSRPLFLCLSSHEDEKRIRKRKGEILISSTQQTTHERKKYA